MATDDDASGADPEGDGTDASGGDGEDSPSTLQGDAVDRGTDDEGAGDLPATDDERRTANSAEQPPARPDETADTEDGLTITTTYDGDHYATQEISIRREDGHTVVSVSGSTKKLRTTEYLLTLLQDIYGRKSMAQLGYEVL